MYNQDEYELLWDYLTVTYLFTKITKGESYLNDADSIIHNICNPLLGDYINDNSDESLESYTIKWINNRLERF